MGSVAVPQKIIILCGPNNSWAESRKGVDPREGVDPMMVGKPTLSFVHGFFHMVLSMMVFYPWYFVDLVKGTMIMLQSRVNGLGFMNSLACIYMYYNIETKIMKNQSRCSSFGIQRKISVYIVLTIVYFFVLRIHVQEIYLQG